MWQTQSKTNAETLRSRAAASCGPGLGGGHAVTLLRSVRCAARGRARARRAACVSLSRADRDRRSMVHTGSHTTRTSTVSTPSRRRRRSGIASVIGGDERAPARRRQQVHVDVRAVDADVLDDAHVDDADAAVGAARVVDVAQRVERARRGPGARTLRHGSLPGSVVEVDGDAKAGGGGGAGRVGGQRRATRARPTRGRGSEPPRTVRQPSSSGGSADPLPDVAGELLGAARRGAVGVRA